METLDLAGLMEEPPGGRNYGRAASSDPQTEGKHVGISADEAQTRAFMQDGGWGFVSTSRGTHASGATDAGMSAHRGVISNDEYVDLDALRSAVAHELGVSIASIHAVYRQGRMTDDQREFRASIDARLLALSRSGGNMLALARVFGWKVKAGDGRGGSSCDTMERALARALNAEKETS